MSPFRAPLAPAAVAGAALVALAAPGALRGQAAAHLPPVPADVRVPLRGADSLRAERLAAVGRAWAAARFFHPALAGRAGVWDSALVRALPALRAAATRAEYARAAGALFATLGDPATRVVARERGPAPSLGPLTGPVVSTTADSVLVVTMRHPDPASQFEQYLTAVQALTPRLRAARRVVLDLRAADDARYPGDLAELLDYAQVGSAFVDRPLRGVTTRRRAWSGWPTEGGGSSGYSVGWRLDEEPALRPPPPTPVPGGSPNAPGAARAATRPDTLARARTDTGGRRVAVLVNARGGVPVSLLPLRAAGVVRVIADGPPGAGPGGVARLPLDDSTDVTLRTSEVAGPDGGPAEAADTAVAPSSAGADRAMDAAQAWLRAGGPPPSPAPRSARQPDAPPETPAPIGGPVPRTQPVESRLLAAFKLWGVMEYFHAYRALYPDDWYRVLVHMVPRYEAAADSVAYGYAVLEHVSHIEDAHGFVAYTQHWRPVGRAVPALRARMLGDALVVTRVVLPDSVGGLRVGDVLERVDGMRPRDYVTRAARTVASSNAWTRDRNVAPGLLAGPEGADAVVEVRSGAGPLRTARVPRREAWNGPRGKQRTGPVWRRLAPDVGYVDLDRLTEAQIDSAMDALADARAIVWDLRGYPNGTAFTLPRRLTTEPSVPVAWFGEPRPDGPRRVTPGPAASTEAAQGTTYTIVQRIPGGGPGARVWRGRSVILADETTQSQAEHSILILSAAMPGTCVVGSPTAGANGDVTQIALPGGIGVMFSGHDVRWPDGRQLQQVGVRPDVPVRPTVAGIRAGRDEVLEAGLAEVRRLLSGGAARPPRADLRP